MTEPRPKTLTREAALRVGLTLAGELSRYGLIEKRAVEKHARDIAGIGQVHMDGYELGKELERRRYWEVDFAIAEVLDRFSTEARREMQTAEAEWAARNNIQPPFEIGTRVELDARETGVITGIDQRVAEYLIKIDGDPDARAPRNARRIVRFERVKPITAVVSPTPAEAST